MSKSEQFKKCRYYLNLTKALINDGTKSGAQSALRDAYNFLPYAQLSVEEIAVKKAYDKLSNKVNLMPEVNE